MTESIQPRPRASAHGRADGPRGARRGAAAALALSVGAGLLAAAPQALAQAPERTPAKPPTDARAAGETVLPGAMRPAPRELRVSGLGETGLVSRPEGSAHHRWTEYATGRSWDLPWLTGQYQPRSSFADTFYEYQQGKYRFTGPDGGDQGSVTVPRELRSLKVVGTTVVASRMESTSTRSLWLLKPGPGGATLQQQVSDFPGTDSVVSVAARDARTALITYRVADEITGPAAHQAALIDLDSGRATRFFEPYTMRDARRYLLSDRYVGLRAKSGEIRLLRRDDPKAPEIALTAESLAGTFGHTLVGDHVVARESGELGALVALPLDGGPRQRLLEKSHGAQSGGGPGGAADGSGVYAGGTGPDDWAVHRVAQGADGALAVTELAELPRIEASVTGLAFSRSTLTWTDRTAPATGEVQFKSRTIPAGKNPQAGPVRLGGTWQAPCGIGIACAELYGAGDGSVVYQSGSRLFRQDDRGKVTETAVPGPAGSAVAGVGGVHTLTRHGDRYALLDWRAPTAPKEFRARAAALWEGQLWTAEKPGKLSLTRPGSSEPAVTVNTGASCVPDELQAVGRWVYWNCDAENEAGVLDRARGRSVPVSDSPALLGDGVLVHKDDGGPDLWRTVLTSGKAVTSRLGRLTPDEGGSVGDRRHLRWTLDPHTNRVAHTGPKGALHLIDAAPAAPAAARDHAGGDGVADLLTLNSSGAFTFQKGTGAGGYAGKVSGGGWKARTTAVPFGDLDGDGCNDVLVRLPDGELRAHRPGCGKALTPATPSASLGRGWNAYNVLTSPGDLTGDGRADLLARKASDASLHLFAAKGDGTLAAGKKIASGWNYTHITGVGDLNGDKAGDVVARAKDGVLYRFDGTGKGALKNRVKLFTRWGSSYNTVLGAGDITGDGRPDLVSRDAAGDLYRNSGDGKGSFGSRTKISGGWKGYAGLF
ncbi:FG-GAP repeat domain-containing protein [Streptomyces sp. NPDC014894]|uniref:FG-GAP repeat domain-containing protein n=1 Tax=Streptomyces sp. NPDC014894 TaxID=3364931 RepID=UPI0036F7FC69